jgi:hypothetical protein
VLVVDFFHKHEQIAGQFQRRLVAAGSDGQRMRYPARSDRGPSLARGHYLLTQIKVGHSTVCSESTVPRSSECERGI